MLTSGNRCRTIKRFTASSWGRFSRGRPYTGTVSQLLEAVAEGRMEVVIDRVIPLHEASKAHEYAETAKPLGRVVMVP
ncbi:zinc-binding dehydrogenase [Rhizobium leguminosarum]|uniref:zinc-binding dehydrogenase n=1 Tax=Rhizobium TaxID=379 RepID=UPI0021BBF41B|nr:zinc-binding dehydrogenase [Rhizobium leguminosarum]